MPMVLQSAAWLRSFSELKAPKPNLLLESRRTASFRHFSVCVVLHIYLTSLLSLRFNSVWFSVSGRVWSVRGAFRASDCVLCCFVLISLLIRAKPFFSLLFCHTGASKQGQSVTWAWPARYLLNLLLNCFGVMCGVLLWFSLSVLFWSWHTAFRNCSHRVYVCAACVHLCFRLFS